MTAEPFLKNQWYVAGRSHELATAPLARTICGETLVFFRRRDGAVAALQDRCPHRKYPLSKGQMVGDDIECGYHGIRFNGSGVCTLIPSQTEIPRGLRAHAFPVIEKSALIYVWMGEPAKADPALLHDFFENVTAGWEPVFGYHHIDANYQLVIDNLLDLTHLTFLHKTTLAGPGIQENPLVVTVEGETVRAKREMRGVDPSPLFRALRDFSGKIDRVQDIRFLPPNHVHIRANAIPSGSGEDFDGATHVVLNHLTPETNRTTHYFWSVPRRIKRDDPSVSDMLYNMIKTAFDEDAVAIRYQQESVEADSSGEPFTNLDGDKASAAARRILRRKLDEQSRIGSAA